MDFKRFVKGILLKPDTTANQPTDNLEGSVWYDSDTNRFMSYSDSDVQTMVTESQTQTITNKDMGSTTNSIDTATADAITHETSSKTVTIPNPTAASETFVLEAETQTITNKDMGSSTNSVDGATADTIQHEASGKTVTIPNPTAASETFVLLDEAQTLNNKDFGTDADITIQRTTQSTTKDNGALIVEGGVGIEKNLNVGGNATITGDLQVDGTTTTVNTATLDVEDANITVNNNGNQSSANTSVSGLTVEMNDATDARIGYDSTLASKFKVGEVGSEKEIVDASSSQTLTNKDLGSNTNSIDGATANSITHETSSKVVTIPNPTAASETFALLDETQTLTNKTLTEPIISGGAASATSSIKLPEATTTVLNALTPIAGQIAYDTVKDQPQFFDGTVWSDMGGGSGGINYIDNPDAEGGVTGWVDYAEPTTALIFFGGFGGFSPVRTFTDGDKISLTSISGTPTLIFVDTIYYVRDSVPGVSFNVSATKGGAAIVDLGATGATVVRPKPFAATGGSPSEVSLLQRTGGSVLRGNADFHISKSAGNAMGQGVSYDFTVDKADLSKALTISFDYEVSANFDFGSSTPDDPGDIRVFIYNDDSNQLIEPVSTFLDGSGRYEAQFQTDATDNDYRLVLHVASVNNSSWNLFFDNVVVGPSSYAVGSIVTDWVDYTPTLTTGSGSLDGTPAISGRWRRVGDSMEVQGEVEFDATQTTTWAGLVPSLPNGHTIDAVKALSVANGVGNYLPIGAVTFRDTGTATFGGLVQLSNGTDTIDLAFFDGATNSVLDSVTNDQPKSTDWASGDGFSWSFKVPITGWGTNTQSSSDTDSRVVVARVSGNAAPATANNPLIFPTSDFDTHNGLNLGTGEYICPITGYYQISGAMQTAANTNVHIFAWIDGVYDSELGTTNQTGDGAIAGVVYCNAGQAITIVTNSNHDATTGSISYTRISGPAQIAANELVAARYTLSTADAISGNAVIDYDTQDFDTHGGMSAGTYTCPVAGKYRITAALKTDSETWADNEFVTVRIDKDGGIYAQSQDIKAAAGCAAQVDISVIVDCVAGTELRAQSNSSVATNHTTNGYDNYIEIERIGF